MPFSEIFSISKVIHSKLLSKNLSILKNGFYFELLFQRFRSLPTNEKIIGQFCTLIANCAVSEVVGEKLMELGSLKILFNVLDGYTDEKYICNCSL